jgi:hypothetical protein
MKTPSIARPLLVLVFLVSLGTMPIAAADAAVPPSSATLAEPTFDLDFPGGSIKDLLAAVEKASGQAPNVVIGGGGESLVIPPLKMRAVSLSALFGALQTSGIGAWIPNRSAWAVTDPRTFAPWSQKGSLQVFNVKTLLKSNDINDLFAAIQLALQLGDKGSKAPADVKFHKETGLLLVYGNSVQVAAVHDVLRALESSTLSDTKPSNAPPAAKPQ